MKKSILLALALSLSIFTNEAIANSKTRMQVAIEREQEMHAFTPVTDMWLSDAEFDMSKANALVDNSVALTVNFATLNKLMTTKTPFITLSVPAKGGGTYEVQLEKFDFLSQGFKVRQVAYGVGADFAYTPGVYYRGVIKGHEGSIASFSLFNNEVYGVISLQESSGNIVIVPNTLMAGNNNGHCLMYNDNDVKQKHSTAGCATESLPVLGGINTSGAAHKNVYSTCKNVEQYFVVDYDTYVREGASPTTTTNFANYLTAVYNMVAALYRNEGIYTSLKLIDVHTTADDFVGLPQKSDQYLYKFGDVMVNNLHGADLTMLITTTGGGMGGIAWLNALCATNGGSNHYGPYGFANITKSFTGTTMPVYTWDINVITHEMGHNLSSNHTHDCVWNGDQTAIDGCGPSKGYPGNGNCAQGPIPTATVGGTMMSYCHLVSGVGIKLANGFGQQPGDVIRDYVAQSGCATPYIPTSPLAVKDSVVAANRECTDGDATYYWNDNNNMLQSDDQLALVIKKYDNAIGNLDSPATYFSIKATTLTNFGSNKGDTLNMPAGIAGMKTYNVSSNRFWKITAAQPTTSFIEVVYPFTVADIKDIDGSVPGNALSANMLSVYLVKNNKNPSPLNQLNGLTAADLNIYKHSTQTTPQPTDKEWSYTNTADTFMASVLTKDLYGGAMFYSYDFAVSVNEIGNKQGEMRFYPNPTTNEWLVTLPENAGNVNLQLYSADGKIVSEQILNSNKANHVDASSLPAGIYFYRAGNAGAMFTGTLKKQ